MYFAIRSLVLFLLTVDAFGKSLPLDNESANTTEINNFIIPEENVSCEFDGVFHPLYSTFSVYSDPCLLCECNQNWTGSISDSSCYKKECRNPQDMKLEEGCFHIYDENKCCIKDFYCKNNAVPISEDGSEIETNDSSSEDRDRIVCPTPLCADSSCRIEVPPGWSCPTCVCDAGSKEKNEFEPSNESTQEEPFGSQNATEDSEMFLVPVAWSGVNKEGYEEELNENYEADEDNKPEILKEGKEGEHGDTTVVNSSVNVIPGVDSKPRRRRHASPQTGPYPQQQQQQGWTVFEDEEEGEREREDDFGELKVFGTSEEEPQGPSNEVEEEEDNVVYGTIAPGCPTPTCEHSGCRVGVPPGHRCPTCICSESRRQP